MSSSFVRKEPCPKCGSKDNLARYSDGHAHCFTPGCDYFEKAEGQEKAVPQSQPQIKRDLLPGSFRELKQRRITEKTCRALGYKVGEYNGDYVHIAEYTDADGSVIGQKIRTKNKDFLFFGTSDKIMMFGFANARGFSKKTIFITEGEIDALTVFQTLQEKYPVLSLSRGCKGVKSDILRCLQFLQDFDRIVLAFDADEPGRIAVKEAANLLPPGKVFYVGYNGAKDANEMLLADKEDELYLCLTEPVKYKPENVVTVEDVFDSALEDPEEGLDWFDPRLTKLTYGRRHGELYMIGAGSGIGKTDFILQQAVYDANNLDQKVGMFLLEQMPRETVLRMAGKLTRQILHIPGASKEARAVALTKLKDLQNVFMYDHFGAGDYESIANTIRYLYHANGVQIFYIDHLTALAAAVDEEKRGLELVMASMGKLVKEIPIIIICVSHLSTPETKSHEEGARVMARHFKGSRAITFWSHFMIGLERNQQADDEQERQVTTLRILKDRFTGQSTGQTINYTYDFGSGCIVPIDSFTPHKEQSFEDY